MEVDLSAWVGNVSETTLRQLREYWRAAQGESADLDGDGTLDLIVTHQPDGTTRWQYEPFVGQGPAWIRELRPDKSLWLGVDTEGRAVMGFSREWSPTRDRSVTLSDEDLNNKHDRRTTRVFVPEHDRIDVTVETDPTESGKWASAAAGHESYLALDGECTANTPFWTVPEAELVGPDASSLPNLTFTTSSVARCSAGQLKSLQRATACVLSRVRCLSGTNAVVAAQLSQVLLSRVYVGCTSVCDGRTLGAAQPLQAGPGRVILEPSAFSNDTELCGVLLHELLHVADVPKSPDHNKPTWDKVYACSLLCTKCGEAGHSPGKSPSSVCADCAGTPREKAACGIESRLVDCEVNYTHCHGGIAVNELCASPKCYAKYDCSGRLQPYEQLPYACCATCSSNAPKNDVPCDSTSSTMTTCDQKPRVCEEEHIPG